MGSWPLTHGSFFDRLREAAASPTPEEFRRAICETLYGEIYEFAGKWLNARESGHTAYLPGGFDELARLVMSGDLRDPLPALEADAAEISPVFQGIIDRMRPPDRYSERNHHTTQGLRWVISLQNWLAPPHVSGENGLRSPKEASLSHVNPAISKAFITYDT